jgi:large conductance mechanosensitive channel
MKLIREFKEFAIKGNVMDMAVGIIIGAAFGKMVSSLADDILTPLLNIFVSNLHFNDHAILLSDPLVSGQKIQLKYGVFIQNGLSFLIISFSVFLLIKLLRMIQRKGPDEIKLKNEEKLLTEIRDLLKNSQVRNSSYEDKLNRSIPYSKLHKLKARNKV